MMTIVGTRSKIIELSQAMKEADYHVKTFQLSYLNLWHPVFQLHV